MEGKKVYIFYYGDFDPSGDHMPEDLKERLGEGNRSRVTRKRKGSMYGSI